MNIQTFRIWFTSSLKGTACIFHAEPSKGSLSPSECIYLKSNSVPLALRIGEQGLRPSGVPTPEGGRGNPRPGPHPHSRPPPAPPGSSLVPRTDKRHISRSTSSALGLAYFLSA